MRWDRELTQIFLKGYNRYRGTGFMIESYPEDTDRHRKAVEVIARDQSGATLAVEHTLVQPFGGEREDRVRFLAVFGRLEGNDELKVPGFWISIFPSVGAVPKGVNWEVVRLRVESWLRREKDSLPQGKSERSIPDVGFDLKVILWKRPTATGDGVYFGRSGMPDDFCEVVRERLAAKLPKLVAADAKPRILLFELDSVAQGPPNLADCLEALESKVAELRGVDEIWCAQTSAWEAQRLVTFSRVWPPCTGAWPQFAA